MVPNQLHEPNKRKSNDNNNLGFINSFLLLLLLGEEEKNNNNISCVLLEVRLWGKLSLEEDEKYHDDDGMLMGSLGWWSSSEIWELKWDDVPCFPLQGFKLLVWFSCHLSWFQIWFSLTSEWGILIFSVYKPEWRRYGSQASNFVSLYNIYILVWTPCLMHKCVISSLVYVLVLKKTFIFFIIYFYVFFVFIFIFYNKNKVFLFHFCIFFYLDASLKFGERKHTSFFFK